MFLHIKTRNVVCLQSFWNFFLLLLNIFDLNHCHFQMCHWVVEFCSTFYLPWLTLIVSDQLQDAELFSLHMAGDLQRELLTKAFTLLAVSNCCRPSTRISESCAFPVERKWRSGWNVTMLLSKLVPDFLSAFTPAPFASWNMLSSWIAVSSGHITYITLTFI